MLVYSLPDSVFAEDWLSLHAGGRLCNTIQVRWQILLPHGDNIVWSRFCNIGWSSFCNIALSGHCNSD
jgi:hypothetical protein